MDFHMVHGFVIHLAKRPIYNEFLVYDYFCVYTRSQKTLFNDNLKKTR